MSWHFKWLRDDLAGAHILNTVGTGIAIGLVLAHTFTGYGADRRSLRIMQVGTGIFVLAGPIDVINHRVNGLDLTAWSPSHLLLYGGTAIMIAGVIRNWYHSYPTDGAFGAGSGGWGCSRSGRSCSRTCSSRTGQQEYGILEIASWFRGLPYAEPELISFAAGQIWAARSTTSPIESFALPIAPWVYPVWTIGVCAALLVFARIMIGWRWTATAVVAAYVLYRCLIWPLLTFTIFPPSVVPFWLLLVGLAVDTGVPAADQPLPARGGRRHCGDGRRLRRPRPACGDPGFSAGSGVADDRAAAGHLSGRRAPEHAADRLVLVVGGRPRPDRHLGGSGRARAAVDRTWTRHVRRSSPWRSGPSLLGRTAACCSVGPRTSLTRRVGARGIGTPALQPVTQGGRR